MEELLEWPWKRFEVFYREFKTRQLIQRLEAQRDQMVASLWSNSAYDEAENGNNARAQIIGQIDGSLGSALELVYGSAEDQETGDVEPTYDPDNPFFAKAKEGLDRVAPPRGDELDSSVTAAMVAQDESDVNDMWKDIDQAV